MNNKDNKMNRKMEKEKGNEKMMTKKGRCFKF